MQTDVGKGNTLAQNPVKKRRYQDASYCLSYYG